MSEREEVFFFPGSHQRKLFGFLHLPAHDSPPVGIVYCHPFAEEKNCSHAIAAKAGRAFARQGFAVLRFDFSGCGDSEDELENVTIDDWLEDLQHARARLAKETGVEKIVIWGLRLGAGLALLQILQNSEEVAGLVLWQPVMDFKAYIHQFMRQAISANIANNDKTKDSVKELIGQMTRGNAVEVAGYRISLPLYESFIAAGHLRFEQQKQIDTSFISISLMDRPSFISKKMIEELRLKLVPFSVQHLQIEPFWDRYWCWEAPQLIEKTSEWLGYLQEEILSNGKTRSI